LQAEVEDFVGNFVGNSAELTVEEPSISSWLEWLV
jgi:hypothetical protein